MAALVLTPGCTAPRSLGAVSWVVFETVALAAEHDETGWIAALGVRDIAASVGINKDTAARAVVALTTAGLVTRERLRCADPARRTGYRLHLPTGTELCPADADSVLRPASADAVARPAEADTDACPGHRDNPRSVGALAAPGPSSSDGPLCPDAPDGAMRRASSPQSIRDDRDKRVCPTEMHAETEATEGEAVIASLESAASGDAGDRVPVGVVRAVSRHTRPAAPPPRLPRLRPSSVAQDDAQGQLFDLGDVVTIESQDR